MASRIGPGPVFAYEWMARSRRWQEYATRSGFLLLVMAALALVRASAGTPSNRSTAQVLAEAGRQFFQALALTQLALVMLAAPAATAGAICLDRAKGSLAHALVTDLSDGEIVLGKLAARLVPVLGLVACALPVAALGTLLGGIDPKALTGAFLVTAALAVLGCTLALALSNWLAKTHEVLTVVYALWAVWLLAWDVFEGLAGWSPYWMKASHPIWVMFAPYSFPGATSREPALFVLACLTASAVLAAVAVRELRPAYRRQLGRRSKESREGRAARRFLRDVPWWPNPSLDRNPVLWREWHRARPALATRIVWWLYLGISSFFSLRAIWSALWHHRTWGESASLLNAFQVTFGLLLLSVSAATALAEERVRGSLDVLLATPLPTKAIVWGKWWGVYRWVPWLAAWPFLVNLALFRDRLPDTRGAVACYLVPALILVHGAAITSLGLALATWTPRLGRAVAGTVASFVLMTVAWPILGIMLNDRGPGDGSIMLVVQGSPFYSVAVLTNLLENGGPPGSIQIDTVVGGFAWLVAYTLIALGLLLLTLATFNEFLGRVPEVPRPGWLTGSGSRIP